MDQDTTINLTFMTDEREHARASRAIAFRTRSVRVMAVLFPCFALAGVAVLVTSGLFGFRTSPTPGMVMLISGIAGLVVLYTASKTTARNFYRNNANAEGPHTYSFRAEGVSLVSPFATSTLQWRSIFSCVETEEFFLLYLAKGYAVFLPKRCVSEPDRQALRACLQKYLPGRTRF